MGKAKAQTKHLRKKGAKKAPKQTNLTGLKKPGDPPASPATEPLQIQVSSPRPRLSSDPEEKRKLNTTEQQQKKTMQKSAWSPPTPSQSTPGQKQSPKNQNLMPVPNIEGGRGNKTGRKTGTGKKSPPNHNLSTQSQEQSQAKQHLGPAPKA